MSAGTRTHAAAPAASDLLAGRTRGKAPRAGNPCWRDSYDVDDPRCARFVHGVDEEEIGFILATATHHNGAAKQAAARSGPLRHWGVAVLRFLFDEAKRNKGVCAPSHAQIAQALRIARSTVQRVLDALHDAGFLEWRRRTIIDEGGSGPRRKQTTNLYRFVLPRDLAWRVSKFLVKRLGRKPGLPRSIAAALSPAAIARRTREAAEAREKRRRTRTPLEGALALLGRSLGCSPSPNMRPS